ncbi:helix-turn-helix domain-containing protein [Actinoallomurus iriomotensis]|uniref:Transcriptional regulator n=1 Tax=Actinoallomurus iriomotensis TaxID=478107 RepID=A0A9W6RRA0_9ACTN|nr:helix-turn-helix transcriptional regulator [Actinoallomurus iriomotensis]GLY80100.1 transcriptional regulator [Actinoallomurus iriomotensis]
MVAQKEPYEFPAILAFAGELTAWRMQAGMSKIELAERLGYTPQLIGQVEAAKNLPSKQLAEDLDTLFETNGVFLRLWKLINETRHLAVLPRGFSEFVAREAEASTMHVFEPGIITGLFQTPEYAYEVMKAGRDREEAEQLVGKRVERQKILDRKHPPRIVAIFEEMALRRMLGGRSVMKAQIEHLIDLAERHNITLQVVPESVGSYAGLMGAFTILGFEDGPDLVYVEHIGGQFITDAPIVREYALRYDLIRGAALSADQTLKLLRTTLESL